MILTFVYMFNATGSKYASALFLSVGWVSGIGVNKHADTVNPVTHLLMEV